MTYAVAQELPGVSMEVYRRMMAAIDAQAPQGLILRAVGPAGENLRMVEVWDSKDDRDRFVRTSIQAARQAVGGSAMEDAPHDHFEVDVQDLVRP